MHVGTHRKVISSVICSQGELHQVRGGVIKLVVWAQPCPAPRNEDAIDGGESTGHRRIISECRICKSTYYKIARSKLVVGAGNRAVMVWHNKGGGGEGGEGTHIFLTSALVRSYWIGTARPPDACQTLGSADFRIDFAADSEQAMLEATTSKQPCSSFVLELNL